MHPRLKITNGYQADTTAETGSIGEGYLFTYVLLSARLFEEVMQLDLFAVFNQIYYERFEVVHEFPTQEDFP